MIWFSSFLLSPFLALTVAHFLTLMLIRNVVLSLGVDQQGGHEERLVQLVLQVDVVVACRNEAQSRQK